MPDIEGILFSHPWASLIAAFLGFCAAGFLFNTFVRGVLVRGWLKSEPTRDRVKFGLSLVVSLAAYIGGAGYFAGLSTGSIIVLYLTVAVSFLSFFLGIALEPRLNLAPDPSKASRGVSARNFWNRDHILGVAAIVGSIVVGTLAGWATRSTSVAFFLGALVWIGIFQLSSRVGGANKTSTKIGHEAG